MALLRESSYPERSKDFPPWIGISCTPTPLNSLIPGAESGFRSAATFLPNCLNSSLGFERFKSERSDRLGMVKLLLRYELN